MRELRREEQPRREPEPEAAPDLARAPGNLLALQRAAGNRATAQLIQRQGGALDAIQRGGEMYWNMDDEGAQYARELMRWRLVGLGMDFDTDEHDYEWNNFMQGRPEIQRAMLPVLESIAVEAAADGATEEGIFFDETREYTRVVRGVALNELESMRLTLHGCHRIDVTASVFVRQDGADTIAEIRRIEMTWVDRADLHPGTETELESGELVDDAEFTAAGWDYNVNISFVAPPDRSVWRVSGSSATHERGWPPVAGAPAGGFRG
jgi:hypothetical protein